MEGMGSEANLVSEGVVILQHILTSSCKLGVRIRHIMKVMHRTVHQTQIVTFNCQTIPVSFV